MAPSAIGSVETGDVPAASKYADGVRHRDPDGWEETGHRVGVDSLGVEDGDGGGRGEAGRAQDLDEVGRVGAIEASAIGFVEVVADESSELGPGVVPAVSEFGGDLVEASGVGDGEGADGTVAGELGRIACFVDAAGEGEAFEDAGRTGVDSRHPPSTWPRDHVDGDLVAQVSQLGGGASLAGHRFPSPHRAGR